MSKVKDISSLVSDQDIIIGIAQGDSRIISKLYKLYYPSIAHMIINNNGSDDQAKDIFQEAVMVLYDKVINQENFELSSKVSTYLYAVSRRLWLKQLTRKGSKANTADISDFEDILQVEDDIEDHNEKESNFEQMHYAMQQLGEPCQTILKDFYISNKSMQDICEKFGYTNTDNAKTQKYKCLQRLKKLFFSTKIQE